MGKSSINGPFSMAMLNNQRVSCVKRLRFFTSLFLKTITCWWLTYPSEKYEFVSWDDDIPNIWKVKKNHVPNHQPDHV